jgi:hypothetical protein
MVTATSNVAVRDEFLALVLADPDLLDLAFDEVIASWEAESPQPPDRTLVATGELPRPRSRSWRANDGRLCWHRWLRAIPRPKVARSPPELSVRGCRVDPEFKPWQCPMESAREVVASRNEQGPTHECNLADPL